MNFQLTLRYYTAAESELRLFTDDPKRIVRGETFEDSVDASEYIADLEERYSNQKNVSEVYRCGEWDENLVVLYKDGRRLCIAMDDFDGVNEFDTYWSCDDDCDNWTEIYA